MRQWQTDTTEVFQSTVTMSALAMLLTVVLVVPEKGPEKVSDEVQQGLALSGEWEGTFELAQSTNGEAQLRKRWFRAAITSPCRRERRIYERKWVSASDRLPNSLPCEFLPLYSSAPVAYLAGGRGIALV